MYNSKQTTDFLYIFVKMSHVACRMSQVGIKKKGPIYNQAHRKIWNRNKQK